MATVEELIKQYETDPELQKEVQDIIADGKVSINEFRSFAEFSDVLLGRVLGRQSADERIISYNIGLGLHDVWFASNIYNMIG